MTTTLNEVPEDIAMKGSDEMLTDEDKRLTPAQREIRDRCDKLPKRLRRSIDQFRTSVGIVPLWGSSLQQQRQRKV